MAKAKGDGINHDGTDARPALKKGHSRSFGHLPSSARQIAWNLDETAELLDGGVELCCVVLGKG